MVVRNEASKWLDSCLAWNSQWADELHVYDDRSTDETTRIVLRYTDKLGIRPEAETSFIEHEGRFRQAAWDHFEAACDPQEGDWVFCVDADEFLVGSESEGPRKSLEDLVSYAEGTKKCAAAIRKPEVWDASTVPLKVRVDGYWADDKPVRFVQWKPEGKIQDARLGCGSVPLYGFKGPIETIHLVNLLHFGYSVEGETERKYSLYRGQEGNRHNSKHVDSIVKTPTLSDWKGPVPKFWLGVR
jgi:glycosyltransferase involved in cell wall biosynthesis